jgi:hypothetical protein
MFVPPNLEVAQFALKKGIVTGYPGMDTSDLERKQVNKF